MATYSRKQHHIGDETHRPMTLGTAAILAAIVIISTVVMGGMWYWSPGKISQPTAVADAHVPPIIPRMPETK
jgi:hypothetical protein